MARWIQLLLGLLCMIVISSPQYVWALFTQPLTASLGSTESLVMAPQLMGSRDFTAEQVRQSGIAPGTVRLSIGLEDLGDLIADVDQALAQAAVQP